MDFHFYLLHKLFSLIILNVGIAELFSKNKTAIVIDSCF